MNTLRSPLFAVALLLALSATASAEDKKPPKPSGASPKSKPAPAAEKPAEAPAPAPAPKPTASVTPGPKTMTAIKPAAPRLSRVVQRWAEIDADKDGKATEEDIRKLMPDFPADRFRKSDVNHDGFLTKEESIGGAAPAPAAPTMPNEPRRPIAFLLQHADKNQDKKISTEEAAAGLPNLAPDRFSKLDTNHDGFLDAADMPGREAPLGSLGGADKDKDGKVSADEFKAAFPNAGPDRFKQVDLDHDGVLGEDEQRAITAAVTPAAKAPVSWPEQLKSLIGRFDEDKDGKVSFDEAEKGKSNLSRKSFDELDSDKDGFVTVDDKKPAPAVPASPVAAPVPAPAPQQAAPNAPASGAERFKRADKNGDGKLSYEEAVAEFTTLSHEDFKQRDRSGDGFLGQDDRPAAPGKS